MNWKVDMGGVVMGGCIDGWVGGWVDRWMGGGLMGG